MQNFLNAFQKTTKKNGEKRQNLNQQFDRYSKAFNTEPSPEKDRNLLQHFGNGGEIHAENQPYVKVLNLPKDNKDQTFERTRDVLVAKSQFEKLNHDRIKSQ